VPASTRRSAHFLPHPPCRAGHRQGGPAGAQRTRPIVRGGGHPRLKNNLRRPQLEEIGDRTTVFEFGGLGDRQRDYIDWVLKNSVEEGVAPEDIITEAAATRLAAKLKTPLQIGQHLMRAFKAAFEIGAKPVDENVVEAVLSLRIDDLEPRPTRSG
jgi:type II secretory pathway predicted ATPase ExeA